MFIVIHGGLCKVCVLFNLNSESKPRGKFVKIQFQDLGKLEKTTKHEAKE